MSGSAPTRARVRLFAAIAMTGSFLITYGILEAAYRGYLYYLYVFEPRFAAMTIDVRSSPVIGRPGNVHGYYQPHKPITFSYYLPDGQMAQRHTVRINNYGWPSSYDYPRAKPKGDFRIAILGDSMTASINNAVPWPDVTQRHLDEDADLKAALGVERITVLNLGVAGASLQFMATPLAVIARRFSADAAVVNFIGDDLRRRHGIMPLPAEPEAANEDLPPITAPDIEIDGVGIDLLGCETRTLADAACQASPFFTVSAGTHFEPAEINRIKAKLAAPVAWPRIVASGKPLLLLELMGRPAVPRLPAPKALKDLFRPEPKSPILMRDIVQSERKEAEDLEVGVQAIRTIRRLHGRLILLHNPTYWSLTGQLREPAVPVLGERLKGDGLRITDMRAYLPPGATEPDWFKWYNLPHDGHWSDAGAEVYGRAVYQALRETLLEGRRLPPSASAVSR